MPSPDFDGLLKENTMQEITLTLTIEETNAILQVLGDLPTKTGAWNLVVKVKEQAEAQLPKPTE